jgi:hypothetical protein
MTDSGFIPLPEASFYQASDAQWARWFYSGCQKNVAVFKRFFSTTVHALMPQFRNCVILNIIMKSGIKFSGR